LKTALAKSLLVQLGTEVPIFFNVVYSVTSLKMLNNLKTQRYETIR